MVYATCLNGDCTKDEWWLKKPPSEYASGGPKCPDCGTTRVKVGGDEGEPDAAQPAQKAEPAQAPAKAQQQGGGDSTALATEKEALSTGAKVGKMIAGLSADSPEEQAATQGKLMTALGSTVASMGQEMTEKRMNEIERSKQADESSISAVDDYVSCPDCGTQITELPEPGTQFRCPGCNQLLQSQ
jgi:ribosomal protein S27E